MSTARRLALAVAFILTRYASGTAASVITERENAPGALAAYTGEATVPLDSSCSGPLYASRVTPSETWDIALARDPRNGLTFPRSFLSATGRFKPCNLSFVEVRRRTP